MELKIKELEEIKTLTLHKPNKELIAELDVNLLQSLSRSISETDKIELLVPKFVSGIEGKEKKLFINYKECDFERTICVNNKDYFVIKEITKQGLGQNRQKRIVAYSLEKNLGKIDFEVEDIGFYLIGSDEEKGIYSLDEYMYQETGWRFGHIDDVVRYDVLESGEKVEKLRWQESVSTQWYDFLNKYISEQFECVVMFNTGRKEVNLYNIDSFGDELVLSLSNDGYLKNLENSGTTSTLVTRLVLVGNEDTNILEETPTGYPYIEDYSYFIQKGDMSSELTFALSEYNKMVEKRTVIWQELRAERVKKKTELINKKNDLLFVISEINALRAQINSYSLVNDTANKVQCQAELTKKQDKFTILNEEVTKLENEVTLIQESILNINTLCKRETCTNDNGELIFNQILLDELKNYIYCDNYSNESFLKVEDLIAAGKRHLELYSIPTSTWSVDSANFIQRTLGVRYRSQVNFTIGLGNVVELCDEDKSEMVYFTGFSQDYTSGKLTLELSNKKLVESDIRVIGDRLLKAEKSNRTLRKNSYLLIQQKKNRINLDYTKGK